MTAMYWQTVNSTYGDKYSFNCSTSAIVGTIVAIASNFQLLLPMDNNSKQKLSKLSARKDTIPN